MVWINNDGLRIKFGIEEAVAGNAGAFGEGVAGQRVIEAVIDLTEVGTAVAIVDFHAGIARGSRVQKVEVLIDEIATSSGTPTLNVGFMGQDFTTVIDADGFVAAAPLADLDDTAVPLAGTGDLMGTDLTAAGYITAQRTGGAYTGGKVRVKIYVQTL